MGGAGAGSAHAAIIRAAHATDQDHDLGDGSREGRIAAQCTRGRQRRRPKWRARAIGSAGRPAVYAGGMRATILTHGATLLLLTGLGCSEPAPPWAHATRGEPAVAIDLGVPASCVRDVGQVQPVADSGAPGEPRRPVNTYSIVARDPVTGALGVAVQSHWFAVGTVVAWAESGVGAVATQSFVEPAYGPKGLARMRAGVSAADALAALVAEDARRDVRQVGFVDATGRAAAHTGAGCIAHAGHLTGDGFTVQANMMANDRVVPAMAAAYRSAAGDLADRMLAALDAAQAEGGDIRGCQSAAMLVVRGASSGEPSRDTLIDLRVDDAAAPLVELRRLLSVQRVYDHMNAGDVAVEKRDLAKAAAEYGAAAAAAPERAEIRYWQAVSMATTGDVAGALPIFSRLFAADGRWREVTRRLQPGVIPAGAEGDALIRQIVDGAR